MTPKSTLSDNTEKQPANTQTPEQFMPVVKRVKGPFVHTLIFRFRAEAPVETIEKSLQMLTELESLPGVLVWMIQESIDQRKGRTVLERGVFQDGQAFLDFRNAPQHQAFANFVKDYADWDIVDFGILRSLELPQHQMRHPLKTS
jgi:hypothetical protein